MAGVNKVILVGNLGADPDIREVGGSKVANINLATSESYKDKSGNKVDATEWHRLVIWGKLADVAERYLHKGDSIYAEGKLKTRAYDKDGQKHYSTDVSVSSLTMLGSRQHQASQAQQDQQVYQATVTPPVDDDLPF